MGQKSAQFAERDARSDSNLFYIATAQPDVFVLQGDPESIQGQCHEGSE
jgi:hypothetical protein